MGEELESVGAFRRGRFSSSGCVTKRFEWTIDGACVDYRAGQLRCGVKSDDRIIVQMCHPRYLYGVRP